MTTDSSPLAEREKTVSTQNTLSKQTAAFIAAVAQNLPELSASEMQYLIGKPGALQARLENLTPSLRELVKRGTVTCPDIEFIEVSPEWDFLIMRSTVYPNVGIAVSDHTGRCGLGLRLVVRNLDAGDPVRELFVRALRMLCAMAVAGQITLVVGHDIGGSG